METTATSALVTTFDNAVTFNDKVTIEGETFLNNPVQINVDPLDGDSPYPISNTVWNDPTQDRTAFRNRLDGDIVLAKNSINAAVYRFNPRGTVENPGQSYTWRTHVAGGFPSNITPNNTGLLAAGGTAWYTAQEVTYGSSIAPAAGDILYKGLK